MQTAISLQSINKSFGRDEAKTQVLFDINLDIATEKMTFITGQSGCGKTTLISIIAGILNPDCGEITLLQTEQMKLTHEQKTLFRRENMGFIFQQFNLVPTLTALENAAIPLLIQGYNYETACQTTLKIIEKVGLENKANFYPSALSGGQQQRVAIARALVHQPKILICDEPTASLDGHTGHSVMQLLKEVSMNDERCAIVVTHDNRIYEYADSFIEMEDGRISKCR